MSGICTIPSAGLSWEHFEKIPVKHGWEKITNGECFFVHCAKVLFFGHGRLWPNQLWPILVFLILWPNFLSNPGTALPSPGPPFPGTALPRRETEKRAKFWALPPSEPPLLGSMGLPSPPTQHTQKKPEQLIFKKPKQSTPKKPKSFHSTKTLTLAKVGRRFFHNFRFCPKIHVSYILLDTSFLHRLQSVIRSFFLLMNLQVVQSNTVLSSSDSRILNLYNPSKMSSGGIFVIDNKIPSHFESNS